jgi:hypothetical protein
MRDSARRILIGQRARKMNTGGRKEAIGEWPVASSAPTKKKRGLVSVHSGLLSNFKGPVKNKGILTNILEVQRCQSLSRPLCESRPFSGKSYLVRQSLVHVQNY